MQTHRFQHNLLSWFDQFGRKDLPWQQNKSAYSVWVSEVMLQQTQVNTVIPYFLRFIAQFPTVSALAAASQEEVLHLWTGLGYYARGRNLHKAAQIIQADYQGKFPESIEQLLALPGIGRSTAAAVLSLSVGQQHAILDGNVKRILCRFFKVEGWSGRSDVIKQLWQLAEQVTPDYRCADFNQAMMDLGSSLCSRSKPQCEACPLKGDCQAFLLGKTDQYPQAKPKKTLPERESYFLIVSNANQEILLEKRPSSGLWGGLWVFPQVANLDEIEAWLHAQQLTSTTPIRLWQPFRHTFSHYHLQVKPVHIAVNTLSQQVDPELYCWYSADKNRALGLPSPVVRLLRQLHVENTGMLSGA
ncbi:MAG: A/G-specific adenine glycosylase [Methylococcales bacterium]|nr:A/G-specific adenine glycosylase [Methylococcales bacterium]